MTDPKDIANIQKKIHRGVTGYNVYEVTIGDELWELKTEVFKNKSETRTYKKYVFWHFVS